MVCQDISTAEKGYVRTKNFGGGFTILRKWSLSPQMVSDPHKDQSFEPVENAGFTSNDLQLTVDNWAFHGGKSWSDDPSDFSFLYHVDHQKFPQWWIHVDHPCGIPTGTRDPNGSSGYQWLPSHPSQRAHFCISITKSLRPGDSLASERLWTSAHWNRDHSGPLYFHCFIREISQKTPSLHIIIVQLELQFLPFENCETLWNYHDMTIISLFKLPWFWCIYTYLHTQIPGEKPMVALFWQWLASPKTSGRLASGCLSLPHMHW